MLTLAVMLFWHSRDSNLLGLFSSFLQIISLCIIIGLQWRIIKEAVSVFLNIFAILSTISLLFWILYLFGIDIFPASNIGYEGIYQLSNHIVFIETEDHLFKRFQCLFVEPGMYGMLCVISLILNEFKKDKKSFIYLASALFSLSLSTYILLTLSFLYRLIFIRKIKIYTIVIAVGCLTGLVFFVSNYNDGDNIINEAIFFRLKLDDDNKMIAYNRNTVDFDDYYKREVKGNILLFGIGSETYKAKHFDESVDIKAYITLDGLVGFLFLLLFYLSVLRYSRVNTNTILLVAIFLIIFYRGFVFTFTYGGIILYLISLFSFKNICVAQKYSILRI